MEELALPQFVFRDDRNTIPMERFRLTVKAEHIEPIKG